MHPKCDYAMKRSSKLMGTKMGNHTFLHPPPPPHSRGKKVLEKLITCKFKIFSLQIHQKVKLSIFNTILLGCERSADEFPGNHTFLLPLFRGKQKSIQVIVLSEFVKYTMNEVELMNPLYFILKKVSLLLLFYMVLNLSTFLQKQNDDDT